MTDDRLGTSERGVVAWASHAGFVGLIVPKGLNACALRDGLSLGRTAAPKAFGAGYHHLVPSRQ